MSHARRTVAMFFFLFISPEGISKLNYCALHFFAMYLSPLKPKACAAKTDFLMGFQKSMLYNGNVWAGGSRVLAVVLRFTFWLTFLKNPSVMPVGIFLVYL